MSLDVLDGLMIDAEGELERHGVSAAASVAVSLTDAFSELFAGGTIYLPKNAEGRRLARDQQIFARFNGRNVLELANEFGMTDSGMYRLLERARERVKAGRVGVDETQKGSETTHAIVDQFVHVLKSWRIPQVEAHEMAVALSKRLAERCGGRQICFPVRFGRRQIEVEANVARRHTSTNTEDLAAEMRVSLQNVCGMIRRAQAREPSMHPKRA